MAVSASSEPPIVQSNSGDTQRNTVGGVGGTGSDGGSVAVNGSANISTSGALAIAGLAQSIGGGGGFGASTVANSVSGGDGLTNAVGGTGAGGGAGGNVSAQLNGTMVTTGAGAAGFVAQSIGGGGGVGGTAAGGAIRSAQENIVGGYGGAGSTGGSVALTGGNVGTTNHRAHGLIAQSIGGGGGLGGIIASAGMGTSAVVKNSVGGRGGQGTVGGSAGSVNVQSAGMVVTAGNQSTAVLAQAIGGGGGDGGVAVSTNPAAGTASLIAGISSSVGGHGGSNGLGGSVVVASNGTIATGGSVNGLASGYQAHGLVAQSIGGGGGVGGFAASGATTIGQQGLANRVGGNGGSGNNGSTVTVTNSGAITIGNSGSSAILAQSIGGGGGSSGIAGAFAIQGAEVGLANTIGGSSGSSGDGNLVTARLYANPVVTRGDRSIAVLAQSIGGGGGDGSYVFAPNSAMALWGGFTESVGGTVQAAGSGGNVFAIAEASSAISTSGNISHGIAAQSIGGGGGHGGIVSTAANSFSHASRYSVGGSASSGSGGSVAAESKNSISTTGGFSVGMLGQSIGGGGGVSASAGQMQGSGSSQTSFAYVAGGANAASGNGGAVTMSAQGTIATAGDQSIGILGQSVGGGGGIVATTDALNGNPTIGGNGSTGDGGTVAISNGSGITTTGVNAHGVLAQSVGGGGGLIAGLRNLFSTVVASVGGGSGNGGNVTVTNAGRIATTGARAHGIVAQSVGGGGGISGGAITPSIWRTATPGQLLSLSGDYAGTAGGTGAGGAITVTTTANVSASGLDSAGIFAQSDGKSASTINVTIGHGAAVTGGSGAGIGVAMLGGSGNTLVNNGRLTTVGGIDGTAVLATSGDDTVRNFGTLIGSVDLGRGANSFFNAEGGTFAMGQTVALGAGNKLINSGVVSPGGAGVVSTTSLTGSFIQSSSGNYLVDLDTTLMTADMIAVTGSATLAGTVVVNPVSSVRMAPGTYTIPILATAAQTIDHSSLALTGPASAVATYSLVYPSATQVAIGITVDYSHPALSAAARPVGSALNRILALGPTHPHMHLAAHLHGLPSSAALSSAYEKLSGEGLTALQNASKAAFADFSRTLSDVAVTSGICRDSGSAGSSITRQCYKETGLAAWGSASTSRSHLDGSASGQQVATQRLDRDAIALGLEGSLSPSMQIGLAVGHSKTAFNVDKRSTKGDSEGTLVGLYGRTALGPYYISAQVVSGWLTGHTNRAIDFAPATKASATTHTFANGANIEVGRLMNARSWSIRPFAGVTVVSLDQRGFDEIGGRIAGGAASFALHVNKRTTESAKVYSGLEWKAAYAMPDGTIVSPRVRGEFVHDTDAKRGLTVEFTSARGISFDVEGARVPRNTGNLGIGLTVSPSGKNTFLDIDAGLAAGAGYSDLRGRVGFRAEW